MPIFRYVCGQCGAHKDEFRHIEQRDDAPVCHDKSMDRMIMPTMVAVFTPYRAIAGEQDGGERPMIRNRKEHQAFLRRNGYEEVGNDKSMAPPHPEELAERKAKWKDEPTAPMVDVEKLQKEGWIQEDLTA